MHLNRQQRRAAARTPRPTGPETAINVRSTGRDGVAITFLRPLEHGGPVTVDTTADQAEQIAEWLHTAARYARM